MAKKIKRMGTSRGEVSTTDTEIMPNYQIIGYRADKRGGKWIRVDFQVANVVFTKDGNIKFEWKIDPNSLSPTERARIERYLVSTAVEGLEKEKQFWLYSYGFDIGEIKHWANEWTKLQDTQYRLQQQSQQRAQQQAQQQAQQYAQQQAKLLQDLINYQIQAYMRGREDITKALGTTIEGIKSATGETVRGMREQTSLTTQELERILSQAEGTYRKQLEDIFLDVIQRQTELSRGEVARRMDMLGMGAGSGAGVLLAERAIREAVQPLLIERERARLMAERDIFGTRTSTLSQAQLQGLSAILGAQSLGLKGQIGGYENFMKALSDLAYAQASGLSQLPLQLWGLQVAETEAKGRLLEGLKGFQTIPQVPPPGFWESFATIMGGALGGLTGGTSGIMGLGSMMTTGGGQGGGAGGGGGQMGDFWTIEERGSAYA